MTRYVTRDHVLFAEALRFFRPPDGNYSRVMFYTKPLTGYLLFDFDWPENWAAGGFLIGGTTVVPLPGPYAAFVAAVELPEWVEPFAAHQVTTALATIISFVIGRPVRSPRDSYLARSETPDYQRLAIQFPVVVAGPGIHSPVPEIWRADFSLAVADLVSLLLNLPYDAYVSAMESMRLVHMAQLYKRDDFGLSYYLLVSSIETVAQKVISTEMVEGADPIKDAWLTRAKEDSEFADLLAAFQDKVDKARLKARFVEFVLQYCPPTRWAWADLEHPLAGLDHYLPERHRGLIDRLAEPLLESLLSPNGEPTVRKLLKSAYDHRSGFTHQGQSPPHHDPNSDSRIFQVQDEYNVKTGRFDPTVLPGFRLMSFIARHSILAYFETLRPPSSRSGVSKSH